MTSYLRYIKRAVVFFVLFVLLLTVQKLPVSAEEEDEGKDMQTGAAHGKHDQDHDLYTGSGKRESG